MKLVKYKCIQSHSTFINSIPTQILTKGRCYILDENSDYIEAYDVPHTNYFAKHARDRYFTKVNLNINKKIKIL